MTEPDAIVAERDRSVVYRRDGTIVKQYKRADPRNDVERAAYGNLGRSGDC